MALIEVEGGESLSSQMGAPTFVGMARVWLARRRFLLGEQQRFFFFAPHPWITSRCLD